MAVPMPGRKPKPAGQALNRNKPVLEWTDVMDVPYVGERPELPETREILTKEGLIEVPLRDATRRWWGVVSSMPHCVLWATSDWEFALATATVADAAFIGGVGAATELRNREKVLGTTADYRRGLRIRYVSPDEVRSGEDASVTQLDDYRSL